MEFNKTLLMSMIVSALLLVAEATAQKMVSFLPMSQPYAVADNATTDKIYVSNSTANTVTVVDGASNTIVTAIPVGKEPTDIGVNAVTNMLYVGNVDDPSVMVIDGSSNKVIATLPNIVGYAFAVNSVSNLVYFVEEALAETNIDVLDGATNQIIHRIPVLAGSACCVQGLAFNASTNLLYAAISDVSNASYSVTVISTATNKVQAQLFFSGVCYIADPVVDQMFNRLYFSDGVCGNLYVVNGKTGKIVKSIALEGSGPLTLNTASGTLVDLNGIEMTFMSTRNYFIVGQVGIPISTSSRSIAANSMNRYYAALYNQSNEAKNGLAVFLGPTH